MSSHRFLPHVVAASMLVALVGCGGVTQFQGAQAFAIAGTPPPPPPPPKVEAAKPPARVELRDNKIEIKEKIQFEVNKAVIKDASFGLLKEIGDVIKQNPQVKKLSIEGHASSEGDPKHNKDLSDQRAKAVMEYLVKKEGIEAARLTAKGWGAEKPIADNATEEGKEKNRRVEFLVVEQDVTKKKVEIDPTTGKEKVVEQTKESIKAPGGPATPAPATKPDMKKKVDMKKPTEAAKKPAEGKK
jgi:outer membrane protein OmpA-like peptidoglycan-associated protein